MQTVRLPCYDTARLGSGLVAKTKSTGPDSPIERALARATQLGMSQTSFADTLGLESPQTLNNWRRRGIPRAQYYNVAKVLDWTIEELLGDAPPSPRSAEWPFPAIPPARITRLTPGQRMRLQGVLMDELDQLDSPQGRSLPRRRKRA